MIKTWGIGEDAAKARAKEIYSKIGRIPCPMFDGELIVFNRHGFTHLLRRGPLIRPRSQRLIRLRLIEHAEAIIKNLNGDIVIKFREEDEIERIVNRFGEKVLEKKPAKSWAFIAKIEDSEIKLVVGQIENGQKEFLSIMAEDFELHEGDVLTKNPA